MRIRDIKRFILEKGFFPKVVLINRPGVIINKIVQKYGGKSSINRMAYIFEDSLVNLQLDTIKKIGPEKTSELWYRIGKDMSLSYLLVSKAKRPPKIIFYDVLEYLFNRLAISGISVGTNVIFNSNRFLLILRGKNNVVCRKTGLGSVFAGFASGVMTFLTGEEIEAEKTKCCYKDNYCEIIVSRKIPKKYPINYERLKS